MVTRQQLAEPSGSATRLCGPGPPAGCLARRWARVSCVLHSGELTRRQRAWAGVLARRARAPLWRWRLPPRPAGCGAISSGRCTWPCRTAERSADLDAPDWSPSACTRPGTHASELAPAGQPARHHLPRAVVEMASAARRRQPHPCGARRRRPAAAAATHRLVASASKPRADVAQATAHPRDHRRRRRRSALAARARLRPRLRRAGLPEPDRQRKVRRPNGVWYLDNDFDDWLVTVEVNGMQHHDLLASEADDVRRGGLQTRGRLVVDISSYAVRHRERIAVSAHGRGADVARLGADRAPCRLARCATPTGRDWPLEAA